MYKTIYLKHFISYQHCCPEIKFLEKLGDENVALYHLGMVHCFHLAENVNKPLILALTGRHPDKVQLAGNKRNREAQNHLLDGDMLYIFSFIYKG